MGTKECIRRNREAIKSGARAKVFDWDKAAMLIFSRLNDIKFVHAGLMDDMEYTSGLIFKDGKIITDHYTYLSSNWATPCIVIWYKGNTDETIECWRYEDETDWDEHTKWPQSAIDILEGKK